MDLLRIGVLGAANIARKVVIPAILKAQNVQLTAVASTSGKGDEFLKNTQLTTREGVPLGQVVTSLHSYEDILRSTDVDAVYIALPNHLHREWSMKAADAGKHVLCEKPAALDHVQSAQIIQYCQHKGIVWMEAFMYRFHPQYQVVQQWIQEGLIGDVKAVHSTFTFTINDSANIRRVPEYGGGSLYDVGAYCVNVSQWIFGHKPRSVAAIQSLSTEGVDEEFSAVMDFGNGQTALIHSSLSQPYQHEVKVSGTQGSIFIPTAFVPGTSDVEVVLRSALRQETVTVPGCDQYALEVEYFADCVLNHCAPTHMSTNDTLDNMETIDALYQAAREHKVIQL